MMKRILCILFGTATVLGVFGKGVDMVKRLAASDGVIVRKNIVLSGIVVSDCTSANMATNPNIAYNVVDVTASLRTAYMVDENGCNGICLEFDNFYDNRLRRNTAIELSLKGCTLYRFDSPTRYVVKGVTSDKISVKNEKAAPPQRIMRYSDLTDDDIYTYVTISDVEFVEKHGSLLNIYEQFSIASAINRSCAPNGYMDGWATLLKDGEGREVYMFINSLCPWRRDGSGVPQGKGSVSGVIVPGEMIRYGGHIAGYAIRPIDKSDIAFVADSESQYRTIVEWNWDDNVEGAVDYEKHGRLPGETDSHIMGDRVRADVGNGWLWSDVLAYLRTDADYNALDTVNRGVRKYGALRFESNTHDWFCFDENRQIVGVNGVYIEFSTIGASDLLTLDFSVVAGNHTAQHSWGYPSEWSVSYSTDGKRFTEIADSRFRLPAIAYKEATVKRVGKRQTACDAALGLTEHCIRLPKELSSCDNVILKIAPAGARYVTLPENPMEVRPEKTVPYDLLHFFVLKFGKITIQQKISTKTTDLL